MQWEETQGSRLSGINTRHVFFWVYVDMGVLQPCRIVLSARQGSSNPNGRWIEMDALLPAISEAPLHPAELVHHRRCCRCSGNGVLKTVCHVRYVNRLEGCKGAVF